jgi:hypothetical protein
MWEGRGSMEEIKAMEYIYIYIYMLHIHIQNRMVKLLSIVVLGLVGGVEEENGGENLTNVHDKLIWNCHNEFPLYSENILIKRKKG